MRITLGPSVVRGNIDESITGLWSFANALGLLTDDIGERTAAAGVTVDGLLIKDAGIPEAAVTAHEAALAILESQIVDGTILARLAANENVTGDWLFVERIVGGDGIAFDTLPLTTTFAYLARVVGDGFARFSVQADGDMAWGDGSGARDTNLFRNAVNELKTDDALTVGGILKGLGKLVVSTKSTALVADVNDFVTGSEVIQLVSSDTTRSITGFAGGAPGRIIVFVNTNGTDNITLVNQGAGSLSANRITMPNATTRGFNASDGAILVYDGVTSRWRPIYVT